FSDNLFYTVACLVVIFSIITKRNHNITSLK
ncbi:uncharacterized protein METZ01_LOCUS310177, partial [marine metagenome]